MKPLLILSFFLTAFSAANAADRPNIILMMGDDHGWEETGYNGHPYVKTPVLDEIAASGLRFDRFYSAHPTCSPTRASFLTGRHPNRMGTFTPNYSMRPEEITFAQILGKAGYRSGHFGKWHVGAVKASSPINPRAMGFDEYLSHDNFFEINPSLSRNGAPPQVIPGESSAVLIDETIRFINDTRKQNKPFLAVVWFGSPHEPYSGLPQDLALYDGLPARYTKQVALTSNETGGSVRRPQGEVLRERYAEITAMDRAIGKLRTFLKEEDLRQNTLLFYCGDNGTSADGSLGVPHRGTKATVYEGGILVPGLVEWPEKIAEPKTTTIRASTSDLLPTLCAITGQPLPDRPIDGQSLVSVLEGDETERPNPLYFWQYDIDRLKTQELEPWIDPELQEGTTPLVKLMDGKATRSFTNWRQPPITDSDDRGPRAIIEGDWKLVLHDREKGGPKVELFNLQADPAEKNNLAKQHPDKVRHLESQMHDWQKSVLHSLTGADYQSQ